MGTCTMKMIKYCIRNGHFRALCYNIVTSKEDNLGLFHATVVYVTILWHTLLTAIIKNKQKVNFIARQRWYI